MQQEPASSEKPLETFFLFMQNQVSVVAFNKEDLKFFVSNLYMCHFIGAQCFQIITLQSRL